MDNKICIYYHAFLLCIIHLSWILRVEKNSLSRNLKETLPLDPGVYSWVHYYVRLHKQVEIGWLCFSNIPYTGKSTLKNHPVLLSPELSFFENAVDPDQMASTKPSDQDLHCFPLRLKMHA